MAEYCVPTDRVINGGGIAQANAVLNQVYANVLGRPVLVPSKKVTSLGSAIFAFLAAGVFSSIEEAQSRICPPHQVYAPDPSARAIYNKLYESYRQLYFEFGSPKGGSMFGDILPTLINVAEQQRAGMRAEATPA
jgi:L-ribulokinase